MSYANPAAVAQPLDGESAIGRRVIGKLHRKIVWYCFFLFMINYLDRVNVGFAALTMNADLGLSAKVYGLGAGIFFLGYIAFEIPSNMILHRVGPRIWIARIMITWGLVGCAMAMIQGAWSFYALRFLLGLAEAGFAPGVLLYMTYWFPKKERGKAVAGFMLATVLSSVVGAPLSGWLLSSTHGWAGLAGWQWMFILEGLPAVIMGVVTLFYLVDRPEQGKWLDAEERRWLTATLAAEQESNASHAQHDFAAIFRDPRMWILTLIYMFNAVAIYGVVLWLPQIVKSLGGLNNFQTGLVAAIPFLCAAAGLILVARSSDRTGERKMHTACAGLCGGVFLAASALAPSPLLGLVLLCIAAMGLWATLGVFWTLPTQFLAGAAAAGGIAMINGFAQVGGFVGPYLVGWIRESTQSFSAALLVLAMSPIIGFFLCLTLKMRNDKTGN
ncbi:MFS transporter [Herbaspirillum sp.]|uniref:MFS transporter n=1 Tax=Herbaspirillum sp. TaxID=1890675 RepID=UPI001B235C87|nr:MFS transporter [Herbaspirillum sp.]MBO9538593.1 MFS transporter [Herbaspirillum sp.]